MLLSIITLNYKKPDLTVACIDSLHKQYKNEFEEGMLELIIVDNNSDDGSVEKLKATVKNEKYKNTLIIANSENSGFGKGCNIGAKGSKGEFILFLNNDTLVKDEGILDMAKYMKENSQVAILGGQLKNPDGTFQPSSGKYYDLFNVALLLFGFQRFGLLDRSPAKITEVDWVKGGLFMIRKDVFQKLSGFDENIFMYIEDMELCYRAKKLGLKTFFYPSINVVHQEHGSASKSFAIISIYKGLVYFYKKHRSYFEYCVLKMFLYIKAIAAIAIGTIAGNSYLVVTYKRALKF